MTKKTIIIIRGLSGSGKSTFADTICGDDETKISVSADDFFVDEQGNYNFNPDQIAEAHDWCKDQVRTYLLEGFETICVANTFTKRWEVEPYLQIASENNCNVHVVSLFDAGMNDAQLAARCVHNVPINSIRSQRKRWEMDVFRETFQNSNNTHYQTRQFDRSDSDFRKPYNNNRYQGQQMFDGPTNTGFRKSWGGR